MYSRYEQETSILWNEEDKTANVYTASPVTMRKLDKMCERFPDDYKCVWVDADGGAKKYRIAPKLVSFRPPVSEAVKERGRKHMERMRAEGKMQSLLP